jgi:hypothetical protein
MSIELSLEDVKRIALHYGFEFEVISFDFDNTPSIYVID